MTFDQILQSALNNGIGVVCALAVLWFAWYRETKSIPQMIDTFAQLTREERVNYQRWHEENRTRLDLIIDGQKEQRHLTNNLANELGLRQAVEAAKRAKDEA